MSSSLNKPPQCDWEPVKLPLGVSPSSIPPRTTHHPTTQLWRTGQKTSCPRNGEELSSSPPRLTLPAPLTPAAVPGFPPSPATHAAPPPSPTLPGPSQVPVVEQSAPRAPLMDSGRHTMGALRPWARYGLLVVAHLLALGLGAAVLQALEGLQHSISRPTSGPSWPLSRPSTGPACHPGHWKNCWAPPWQPRPTGFPAWAMAPRPGTGICPQPYSSLPASSPPQVRPPGGRARWGA